MMKHKILSMIGAGLLLMTVWSCRQESDALTAYDQNENLVFAPAEKSFVAKFNILWNGMNQYYALWDYEAEQGLDWDAVYDEYRPQFEALDKRDSVPDKELKDLMDKVFNPLHDGHLSFEVKNHTTGSTVGSQPGLNRLPSRDDYEVSQLPVSLVYYTNVANGEIEIDADGNPMAMEHSTEVNDIISKFARTPGIGISWMQDRIGELQALTDPTENQVFELEQLMNLFEDLGHISGLPIANAIALWNSLQAQYSFLNVPGFGAIDPGFTQYSVDVKFALFKGNIVYFRLNSFALTMYLDDSRSQGTFDMSNSDTQQHIQQVRQVWQSWFDTVQQLHKNGTLGGVIIDLRANGGGNMNDSKYVVGSLLPAGDIHFGYQRFKRGTGRLDYSPLMPAYVSAMDDPHEAIDEPVVILANCRSVSMSETSTLCAKTMPNATFIGKRTFGAICALIDNDSHSFNYAGYIGVEGVTPVFGHVPSMASYTLEKKLVEAQGITPDIEVDLNADLFISTGQDTQIDRALQFLRTGK